MSVVCHWQYVKYFMIKLSYSKNKQNSCPFPCMARKRLTNMKNAEIKALSVVSLVASWKKLKSNLLSLNRGNQFYLPLPLNTPPCLFGVCAEVITAHCLFLLFGSSEFIFNFTFGYLLPWELLMWVCHIILQHLQTYIIIIDFNSI